MTIKEMIEELKYYEERGRGDLEVIVFLRESLGWGQYAPLKKFDISRVQTDKKNEFEKEECLSVVLDGVEL